MYIEYIIYSIYIIYYMLYAYVKDFMHCTKSQVIE